MRRLEVSGQNVGTIGHRTLMKEKQVGGGNSPIPGIAAVVGFQRAIVAIKQAIDMGEG